MRFQASGQASGKFAAFVLVLSAGIGAAPACDHPASETKAPVTKPAPQPDLAAAANRLLRETAAALQNRTIEPAEEPAFLALLNTAEQLKSATRPAPSERERLRALARVRLRQAAEVLAKQAARKPVAGKNPATIQTPVSTTLAQQLPGLGAGNGALGFGNAAGGATPGGNAAERESAKELMDVITGSIQPESWEDFGGKGVIRYFALGHALVITATSDVHNNVGDLIEQLR
ncbi:MAG: hypothetical protein C0483_10835 [Pirellula sp.]|nr:hypothetical protein [Pirellula sp.]